MNQPLFLQNKTVILITSFMFLCGFTEFFFKGNVVDEVSQRMSDIKQSTTPSTGIEAAEPKSLAEYAPYQFGAGETNPFLIKSFVRLAGSEVADTIDDTCKDADCGDGPPVPHAKYFLENYNIDQLGMIGTMTDKMRGRVALIQTPDSGVVYAAQGEYVGQNNGLILSVNKDRIIIREKYRSPQGWQDRMAKLPLLKK